LRTLPHEQNDKCVEGIVRTKWGMVLVTTIQGGTFLYMTLECSHYQRRFLKGPLPPRALAKLAGRFADDVHRKSPHAATARA